MKLTLTRLVALPPVVDGLCRDAENVDKHALGFPDDGSWAVKWEGLKKAQ